MQMLTTIIDATVYIIKHHYILHESFRNLWRAILLCKTCITLTSRQMMYTSVLINAPLNYRSTDYGTTYEKLNDKSWVENDFKLSLRVSYQQA